MTTYALTCNHHNHPAKTDVLTGSLQQIINALIDHNDHWGNADLAADYWPYVYWAEPDSFTLDDEEEAPETPSYTADAAIAIASSVLDESPKHISIAETTPISIADMKNKLTESEGISSSTAEQFITDELASRGWESDALSEAHFTELRDTLRAEIDNDNMGVAELDDLEEACTEYKQAKNALSEALAHRNAAIIDAAHAGAQRKRIARTAGLDVSMVRRIITEGN